LAIVARRMDNGELLAAFRDERHAHLAAWFVMLGQEFTNEAIYRQSMQARNAAQNSEAQ
jgi:hypothetical protein